MLCPGQPSLATRGQSFPPVTTFRPVLVAVALAAGAVACGPRCQGCGSVVLGLVRRLVVVAMAAEGYNQIYRQSQLGLSLQSALDDLDDQIDPSLQEKVLNHFDRVRSRAASHRRRLSPRTHPPSIPRVPQLARPPLRFAEAFW